MLAHLRTRHRARPPNPPTPALPALLSTYTPALLHVPSRRWNTAENKDLDFGYDQKMFGPHTFVHPEGSTVPNASTTDAPSLFKHFRDDLRMHFGGIRKPRTYSNIALSNSSG